MRGATPRVTGRRSISLILLSGIGAFVGIYLISVPQLYPGWPLSTKVFLIGSFGASAALLYGAPQSPFAQPRHLLLGQVIAAVVGVTAFKLFGHHQGVAAGLAVAGTIVIMQLAQATHPPAGATALIAVLGPAQVHHLGYEYVAFPVLAGALVLLAVALVVNNLPSAKECNYPLHWW